jgi:hypothetical protein
MRRWWAGATTGDRIAIATLGVAILGIIPVYIAFFATDRSQSARTAVESTTEPAADTAAEDTLRSFIAGNEFYDSCQVTKDDMLFSDELVSAFCLPDGPVSFSVTLYGTTLAMYNDFNGYSSDYRKDSVPVPRDTKNCRSGQASKGSWAYKNDTSRDQAGRFICYIDTDNAAWMAWTYDKDKIMVIASREDEKLAALYDWRDKYWSKKS